MFIRNIITTSALVVLLGLTGGSAYAGDAGDNSILSTALGGSEFTVEVYDANAYQAAWKAAHEVQVAKIASTDSKVVEIESTDTFMLNVIPYSDK